MNAPVIAQENPANPIPVLPDKPFDYSFPRDLSLKTATQLPSYNNTDNQNNHLATLGRVLFYDKNLSANKLVSCGSCHKQQNGFDDPSRFSIGFEGTITSRSAMGLTNALFNTNGRYFWDQRAANLKQQVLIPIHDPIEMGLKRGSLVSRVSDQPYYSQLFENAFGKIEIKENNIAAALTGFISSIVSTNSPYDKARRMVSDRAQDFPSFSLQQNQGKNIFLKSCAACHLGEAFIAPSSGENNGLDIDSSKDRGIGVITGLETDMGKFRAPSLGNIAVRAPYMHDGRFVSLGAVIDHYSTQIKNHPNLGAPLKAENGKPRRFNFNPSQKAALIAFLQTLTDRKLLSDPKFSNPFQQ
ncbi:MAG: c-type cytochrome [Rhizobiaceae bacterium]|nr:c-type cytochrome [Rhizobiaceae bacterium]